MKPIKLTIQGFGSYTDKCTVDFTVFENDRLFLITGSTGGGKTTILDAMCFALYCRATGGLRSWEQMRSVGVDDDYPTKIEFEFASGGCIYKFARSRSIYLSRNKTDKKVRDEHACYKLVNNEWHLMEEGAESRISARAEEILGLDCEQFSKIIVLPQGEFRKLLLASSKEKTAIFEKLFLTEKWSFVTDRIRIAAKELKDSLENMHNERDILLSGLGVESKAEFDQKLISVTEEQLEKESIKKDTAVKITELEKLIKDITAVNTAKQKIEKHRNELAKQQSLKATADEDFKRIDAEHESNIKIQTVINSLNGQIGVFKAAQSNASKLKDIERAVSKAKAHLNAKNEEMKICTEQLDSTKATTALTEKRIEQARSRLDTKAALVQKLLTLKNIEKTYEKLQKAKEAVKQLEENTAALRDNSEKGRVKLELLQKEIKQLEDLKSHDTAAVLADGLTDGEPCPVCGSVHHPARAVKTASTHDIQSRLDMLYQAAEGETALCEKLNNQYLSALAEKNNVQKQVDELQTECDGFNIYYRTVTDDIQKTELAIAELDSLKKALDADCAELERLKGSATRLESKISEIRLDAENTKISIEKNVSAAEQILSAMPDNISPEEIDEKLDSLSEQNSRLTKQLESHNKTYNEALRKQEVIEAQIRQLESQLNEFEREYSSIAEQTGDISEYDTDKLSKELIKLRALHDDCTEQSGKLLSTLKFMRTTEKRLKELSDKFDKTESEYKTVSRLSDVISGKNTLKVSIKTFVLTIMLDAIIAQSNIYLAKFSNSRYSLHRVTDRTKGNAMSGLDIDVFDAYYGMYRSVGTLSGGELFLASLSLAFGLSDVVQSYAGGIHLDSIFIDEGFGSLDKETLDTAMRALNQIKDMGRLVGIISHVSELMAMIEPKIIVKSDKNGSHAEVVTVKHKN